MTLLEELVTLISELEIPVETGVFSSEPPDLYTVLTPLTDTFALNADDCPGVDIQETRISLFTRDNPRDIRHRLIRSLLRAGITITNRQYIEFEEDVGLHHYEIDVARVFLWDEKEE